MILTPREELLKIQKSVFRKNQKHIQESIFIKEPGFEKYEASYKRKLSKYRSIASIEEMVQAILKADIIYVGDYHTLAQSQRSFLRILKAVIQKEKRICLGFELLHTRHQKVLDSYLRGKLSDDAFVKKVSLKKRWVFDLWENFRPVFDFSRYHHIPSFGIDQAPDRSSLKKRDVATAQKIADLVTQYPDHKLFVLIGDLHLAPQHLPLEVRKTLKKRGMVRNELILYQNSETIYYQLARQGLEDKVEVVRLDDHSFCRMHTPPVIAQRSYLNWLENEEGEIDYEDAKHSFLELVYRIGQFLRLDVGEQAEKVEVYTCGDLSFLEHLKERKNFKKEELHSVKQQILNSESYYIPKTKTVYLSNLSMNHAGEEAAHFIKHICSGEEKARPILGAFYANILHEGLAFFGSKIINHKRKCFHGNDFQNLLNYLENPGQKKERVLEYQTALIVLEFLNCAESGMILENVEPLAKNPELFFSVTHALGYMLGDKIFYALMDGVILKSEIRQLFYDPWRGDEKPGEIYWRLFKKMQNVKIPKRM